MQLKFKNSKMDKATYTALSKGNTNPKLKMTRAIRRQIYTADIVFSMSCMKDLMPTKRMRDVLGRIEKRTNNINRILYGGGKFVLEWRDYKKFNDVINKIKTIIMDLGGDDELLSPDFFNALMFLVENTYESVKLSKHRGLNHEWKMLRKSMGTFCEYVLEEPKDFDPDWPGYKDELLGVALGKKFNHIMMA